MKILLLLSIAVLSSARMQLKNEWEVWKREHGKAYADSLEESLRHAVWFQNFHHVQEHNKKESFKLDLNEFADLVRLMFLCFPIIDIDFLLHFRQENSFLRCTYTK